MSRYYERKWYSMQKKALQKILEIKSSVSNNRTNSDKSVIKFRKEFDEMYEALKLKTELGEASNL
jgi:hypothetical protein